MDKKEEDFINSFRELMKSESFQKAIEDINNVLAKSGNKRAQIINLKEDISRLEMSIFDKTLTNYNLDNDSKEIDTLLRFYTQIKSLFEDLKKELEVK